jgi:Nitrile hydratase, alpha chain
MSEGSGRARAEMERKVVQRSMEDEDFRRRLIEDPKGAVEQELGARLPEGVRVVTMEESADTIYLVLPSTSMAGAEGVELSDQELESVAGGDGPFDDRTYTGQPYTCVFGGACEEVIDE